ncbi:hypothetical protein AB0M72_10115 [Nocardiopsis dassonvillei]
MSSSPPLPQDPSASTLYLDWVRARAPEREPQALGLMDRLDERMRWHRLEPAYVAGYMRGCLDRAGLPVGHLPWLCDTVGHRLLPRHRKEAAAAYLWARELETEHGLVPDPHHTAENALLFARHGVLPVSEVKAHRNRLVALLSAEDAHREFVRFLDAWAAGGAVAASRLYFPHNQASTGVAPPADLATQVRASVKALGLGAGPSAEETSRVLGRYLSRARGNPVPDGLFRQAERVFAKVPPAPEHQPGIASLFPTSVTDGAVWLRLLESTGIADAMARGRVRPDGGYGAWLSEFHHTYAHVWVRGCVDRQALPEELFALLPRLAPRIRAEEAPVRLYEGRYLHNRVDVRLLLTCDELGIRVDAPEGEAERVRESVSVVRVREGGPGDRDA